MVSCENHIKTSARDDHSWFAHLITASRAGWPPIFEPCGSGALPGKSAGVASSPASFALKPVRTESNQVLALFFSVREAAKTLKLPNEPKSRNAQTWRLQLFMNFVTD